MAFKMELANFKTCDKCGKSDAYDVVIFTHTSRQRTNQIIIHTSCLKDRLNRLIKQVGARIATAP